MLRKRNLINWLDEKWIEARTLLCKKSEGMGTVEIILIIVDNPFTSSTYILSY